MKFARIAGLAGRELRRSARHFALASVGVIVGVAAFSFFMALGMGVREVVLERVFAMDELEVVPRTLQVDVGRLRLDAGPAALDDVAAEQLGRIAGVAAVYPKMKLVVPAVGEGGGALFGKTLQMELAVDGIDPGLVQEDVGGGYSFEGADTHPSAGAACSQDDTCGEGAWCREGSCEAKIPVLVSHHLVELYNGSLSRVHALPKLSERALNGFEFEIEVGESMVEAASRPERRSARAVVVGISRKALPLGITIPLSWVQSFNREFEGAASAEAYHSIVVKAAHQNRVGDVAAGIVDAGYAVSDRGAERAAMLIAVFMLVFGLVATVIVVIAAINVMHVLLMLVAQRRKELGIFRALGATRADVRRLIIAEAASLGCVAGSFGVLLSYGVSRFFDWVSTRYLPDFPYKPDTYFDYSPTLVLGSIVFAVAFCVFGAVIPALRASRTDPARVLSGR